MRRKEFAPVVRRGGDRIRVSSLAFLLSVFVALAANNEPRISWIFPNAFAADPSELAGSNEDLRDLDYIESRNIAENSFGKISSAGQSGGKRCAMSPEEFAKLSPPLLNWIRTTLTANADLAQTVASRGFSRLPLYFSEETLVSAKVVLVDPLPRPPLSSMGLSRFADFEHDDFDGITYIDTFFLKPSQSHNESMHFHELVHVVQWRLLGPERFLFAYAKGLECFGYRQSPLEAMAYDAEAAFANSTAIFHVEEMVAKKLGS